MRDKIQVPIEQLQKGSCKKIKVKCDICGKIFERSYSNYLISNHNEVLDSIRDTCKKCCHSVASDVYKNKTGYSSPAANPDVQIKKEQKYFLQTGYKSPNQNPEVKRKKRDNYYNKTGYYNPSQNPEIKQKKNNTYYINTGYKYCGTSPEDRKRLKIHITKKQVILIQCRIQKMQEEKVVACVMVWLKLLSVILIMYKQKCLYIDILWIV